MRDHVEELLRGYGVDDVVAVRDTASELDRTWLVDTRRGGLVVKESPEGSDAAVMQAALLDYVARQRTGLPVPRLRENLRGRAITRTSVGTAFVTDLCPGAPLEQTPLTAGVIDNIVDVQTRLLGALLAADADALHVPAANDWSIDSVAAYGPLVEVHAPSEHRSFLRGVIDDFSAVVAPRLVDLPSQVIHGDFNLSNLLVSDGAVTGVIDFGDAVNAPRVFDIAVTACYLALALGDLDHPLVERYVAAMTRSCVLVDSELAVLRTLVLARVAIVVLLAREIARADPARADYVLRYDQLACTLLDRVDVAPDAAAEPTMR